MPTANRSVQQIQASCGSCPHQGGLGLAAIVFHIEQGDVIDLLEHPNRGGYADQRVLVVAVDDYAYLVPFVESEDELFLKTIIPSRKATKKYLGGD